MFFALEKALNYGPRLSLKTTGLGIRFRSLCGSEAFSKHGPFQLVYLGKTVSAAVTAIKVR